MNNRENLFVIWKNSRLNKVLHLAPPFLASVLFGDANTINHRFRIAWMVVFRRILSILENLIVGRYTTPIIISIGQPFGKSKTLDLLNLVGRLEPNEHYRRDICF